MGAINTYFAAVDDAAAAETVDAGPAGIHSPTVDGVDATMQARTLLALLLPMLRGRRDLATTARDRGHGLTYRRARFGVPLPFPRALNALADEESTWRPS